MPPDLRRIHNKLDDVVDRLYYDKKFSSEGQWIEHLFMLYEKMEIPLLSKGGISNYT